MAQKNPQAYLYDMLANATFVWTFCQDKSKDVLAKDTATRFVVERGLQNIGEAAFQIKRLDPSFLEAIPDHQRIISMRHVLVHAYDEIKPRVLWDTVTIHLPELIRVLKQCLDSPESGTPC